MKSPDIPLESPNLLINFFITFLKPKFYVIAWIIFSLVYLFGIAYLN